jgi:hypothetical protein
MRLTLEHVVVDLLNDGINEKVGGDSMREGATGEGP